MALAKTFIPYGVYWSTPFCKWQGSLSGENSVKLAAKVAASVLGEKDISPESFDALVLGMTVPQRSSFYGAPWFAGMLGAPGITGPTVSQACATSARVVATAAGELETGTRECVLGVATDRCSNGPHIVYPNPRGIGGMGEVEEWVWDNFNRDPFAKNPMLQTAENVAKEAGISREEQDDIAFLRSEQYQQALSEDRAFQKRYMVTVELKQGKKTKLVEGDEGIFPTTKEGLASLKPVMEGGSVTFGAQTHPADGNAGMVLATKERAAELSRDKGVTIQVLGFGAERVKKGFMPMAVLPAAQTALSNAGVALSDLSVINTHNPFAVNDAYFCRETGVAMEAMNCMGSPLVYGHPQAPTGLRASIEMIEELVQKGGGYGLFSGCAAGDNALALVLRVDC